MIQITKEQAKEYLKIELCGLIDCINGEYPLEINNVDDLYMCTIEDTTHDRFHYALKSMLPQVVDECSAFVEAEQ